MEGRSVSVGVDVLAHLLHSLCDFMRRRGLVCCALNIDWTRAVITCTRIDVLYGQTLQPLDGARTQPEPVLGLIDEVQYLIKLEEAISGLQCSFFF